MAINAIWILILTVSLPHVAETIFSPALLAISHAFDCPPYAAQWTIGSYLIGYTFGTILWGPMADKHGHKTTLTLAFIGFSIFSLVCAVAPNLEVLYLLRFLTGIFGAVASIVPQAYLLTHHSTKDRAIISAKIGQAIAIGPAIGPAIGLFLLSHGPWQLLMLPIGLTGIILTICLHQNLDQDQPKPKTTTAFNIWHAFKIIAPFSLIMGLSISTGFYFFAESRFFFTHHLQQTDLFYQMACWSIAACWFLGPFIAEKLLKKDRSPLVILQYGAILSLISAGLLFLAIILITHTAVLSIVSIALMFALMVGTGMQIGNSITLALTPFKEHGARASSVFAFSNYGLASLVTFTAPYLAGSHIYSFGYTYLSITVILVIVSQMMTLETPHAS